MKEVCVCGYPKRKHIVLEELDCVKNLSQASAIINDVLKIYFDELKVMGNAPCLIYRRDNLRSLEAEAERREQDANRTVS